MGDAGSVSPLMIASIWEAISHNWALISILFTLMLLMIVPALIVAKYVRITLNILTDSPPPLLTHRDFEPLNGEEVDFYAADGIRLRGTFVHPAATQRRGLIIFAPEFNNDRLSCARYCRPLLAAGYDIFTFDFRGHGAAAAEEGYVPRQWASDREVADFSAAIAYAEQWLDKQGRPIELGIFGISRGACAAILASAQNASVKALVVDGAFSSDSTLEHFMKRWAKIFAKVRFVYENHPPEFWRFLRWCLFMTTRLKFKCAYPSVRKVLTRMMPRPMLFIHGGRDSYIPVEQSRALYALSAQPKYLWIVQEAKHNQSVTARPEEYARRTVEFFDRYLARRDDPGNMYKEGRFENIARQRMPRRLGQPDDRESATTVGGSRRLVQAQEEAHAEADIEANVADSN